MPAPAGLDAARPYSLRQLAGFAGLSYTAATRLVDKGVLEPGAQTLGDLLAARAIARLPRVGLPAGTAVRVGDLLRGRADRLGPNAVLVVTAADATVHPEALPAVPALDHAGDEVAVWLPVGTWKTAAVALLREVPVAG